MAISAYAQNNKRPSNDSLRRILNDRNSDDSLRIRAFNALANGYLMVRPDSANFFAKGLLTEAQKQGDVRNEGEAYRLLAISSTFLGQQKEALEFISKSIRIFEAAGMMDKVQMATSNRGNIESSFGDYRSALTHYKEALRLALERNDTAKIGGALINLGVVYEALKENALAERNYKAALQIFLPSQNNNALANLYNNFAVVSAAQKKYKQAMMLYRKGLDLSRQIDDLRLELTLTNNIGYVHLETGRYDSALVYQQRALEGRIAINDLMGRIESHLGLGEVYHNLKDYPSALKHLETALQLADSAMNYPLQADVHKWLYKTHKSLGNSNKALYHFENQNALLDTIQKEELRQSLMSQQFQVELAQQEASFAKEKMRAAEALQRRNQQVVGLIVLAFLFIAASVVFYRQRMRIQVEQQKSEQLLLNILPAATARELKEKGHSEVQTLQETTVLFSDFVGFTELSARLSPAALIELLNRHFSAFDEIMEEHGLEKIKTIGDAYMAAAGVPNADPNHAVQAAKAALAMQQFVAKVFAESGGENAFQIRIGLHSGPVMAGIVGKQKFQYDIWGETVNKASRMESAGIVGNINVSRETAGLLSNRFELSSRGEIEVKGLGLQTMFILVGEKS